MTITRSITADQFQEFLICVDESPEGTFEDAKAIRAMMGGIADDLIAKARALDLDVCNCDGAFNLEIEIYGYLRRKNVDRFISYEAYGKVYGEADGDTRERINRGLISDRDFLANRKLDEIAEVAAEILLDQSTGENRYSVEEQQDRTFAVMCNGGFLKGGFTQRWEALDYARDLADKDEQFPKQKATVTE